MMQSRNGYLGFSQGSDSADIEGAGISPQSKSSKTAVLVLGAPRSGTSALSHVLSQMGVNFGDPAHFVDSERHTHNPIFFELQSLNDFNGRVLSALGHEYVDFDIFPVGQEFDVSAHEALVPQAQELVRREFGEGQLIGMKDPRFAFTLPIWEAALQRMGYRIKYVLSERNIADIVESNRKVNKSFTIEHNLRITKVSLGASAVRLDGKDVFVASYESFLDRAESEAARLADWLEIPNALASKAIEVMDGSLRHEHSGVLSSAQPLKADAHLAAIATEFRTLGKYLSEYGIIDLIDMRRMQVRELSERAGELAERAEAVSARAQDFEHGIADRDTQIAQLTANLSVVKDDSIWKDARITQLSDEIRRLSRVELELQQQLDSCRQGYAELLKRSNETGLQLAQAVDSVSDLKASLMASQATTEELRAYIYANRSWYERAREMFSRKKKQ